MQEQNLPDEEPVELEAEPVELISEPEPIEEEPISLVESGEPMVSSVRAFGSGSTKLSAHKDKFKRPINVTGKGATRCRLFYSKIAVNSLEAMENSINEWIDTGKLEVKHIGHMVGPMSGKIQEPNVIVLVWY